MKSSKKILMAVKDAHKPLKLVGALGILLILSGCAPQAYYQSSTYRSLTAAEDTHTDRFEEAMNDAAAYRKKRVSYGTVNGTTVLSVGNSVYVR